MQQTNRPKPLEGLIVLDFTAFIAGPYASRLMADMGATVIKIEPLTGEATRSAPSASNGMGGVFSVMNAGKKSVTLNLAEAEGRALAMRLSAKADVVLENFRPGVMRRLGLGYDDLSKDNPGLVYCSVSGYGQTGPGAQGAAYAPIVNAASGYSLGEFRYQRARDKPEPTRTVAADVLAANHALIAIMTALYRRRETGRGDHVDSDLQTGLMNMMPFELQEAQFPIPDDRIMSFEPIRAREGFFIVAPATDKNFRDLVAVMGGPDWAADPRFATPAGRLGNWSEIIAHVEVWAADRTAEEAASMISKAGCPARHYVTPAEALDDPHLKETGGIVEVTDRMGRHRIVNTPFRFREAQAGVTVGAPELGADTAEVLGGLLGIGVEELDRLHRRKIV